jgi:hypothetical protein
MNWRQIADKVRWIAGNGIRRILDGKGRSGIIFPDSSLFSEFNAAKILRSVEGVERGI